MSLNLAEPTQFPKVEQTLSGYGRTQAKSGSIGMGPNQDPMIIHRLRSASGHLDSTLVAFETGQPSEQILHQLGAVEAAIREISLAIVKNEMLQIVNYLRTSGCDEERRATSRRILVLYERYCRLLWIR
jgi:DNA-binding FrmR family transcriptional regulator